MSKELVYNIQSNNFVLHDNIIIDCINIPNIVKDKFIFNSENIIYEENNIFIKKINGLVPIEKIIFNNVEFEKISFKNNNFYDYRNENIEFHIKKHNFIDPNINIISKGDAIYIKEGKFSGGFRNMYWLVEKNNKEFYIMNCKGNDDHFFFSKESINKVLKIGNKRNVWYLSKNGYIATTFKDNNVRKIRYLHQHLMDHHGNGLSGQLTVDHINRNKMDNRLENLRLVDQSTQNKNTDKRKRKNTAQELPDGITQDMLPKYVVYYKEFYDKEKTKTRDFFKIEKHPKSTKSIGGSKSNKLTIQEKLTEIKTKLNNLENDVKETKVVYPKGIRLLNDTFTLDLRQDDKRYNMKMKYNKELSENDNYHNFQQKIYDKYENLLLL